MKLTLSEVVFLEGHNIHCPLNAKSVIQQVIELKKAKQSIPHHLDILAGLCQKAVVDKVNFKKLYKSAFCQGMFNKELGLSVRHSLT